MIRNHLYSACFSNIKSYSEALPCEEDPYQSMPLIHFFSIIADINYTLFHRWYENSALSQDNTIVYFDKIPHDIAFCQKNNISVSKDITISNFNMSELLYSLDILESKLHTLNYNPELIFYIEALELRVDEFLLFHQTIDYHNVANLRTKHPTLDVYVCTTYCEYILSIRILSIKRDLEGALEHMRDHTECYRHPYQEEMEAISLIHSNLLFALQNVHSDSIQDDFTESYEENAVRSSVGYQWLKENKYSANPEPLSAISQFEGETFWKSVCEQSNIEIDTHFYTMNNHQAFWIIFFQIIEVVIMSCTDNDWIPSKSPESTGSYISDFFITNNTLKILSSTEIDALLIRSRTTPLFLQSFTEASILFQEKLYVYGSTPTDYLRAFHSWIDIIEHCFDGKFLNRIPITTLKEKIYHPDIKPNITKYSKLNNPSDKFIINTSEKLLFEKNQRISLLSNTQQDFELVASSSSKFNSETPFLANANKSIWF